jgi:hypothetical protein
MSAHTNESSESFRGQFHSLDASTRTELLVSAFLGISVLISAFFLSRESVSTDDWVNLAVQLIAFVLMGNFAHNFVFVWQLKRLPEFQNWAREYRFYGLSIYWSLGLAFLAIWSIVRFVYPSTRVIISKPDGLGHAVFLLLFFLVNSNHTLAQSRGVSFIHSFHQKVEEKKRERIHGFERWFSRVVLVLEVLATGAGFFLFLSRPGGPISEYQTGAFTMKHVVIFRLGVEVIAISSLLLIIRRIEPRIWLMKLLIYVRQLPRFLIAINPFAIYAAYGAHGIESSWIQAKIAQNSSGNKRHSMLLEFASIYVFFGALYLAVFPFARELNWNPTWLTEIKVLIISVAFTHYLSEGFFFHFKNKVSRDHLSPLVRIVK